MTAGVLALFIPILAIAFPMLIAVVVIMTGHQRKMAELIHSRPMPPDNSARDEEVRRELAELRQLVQQQTIALDDIRQMQKALGTREESVK